MRPIKELEIRDVIGKRRREAERKEETANSSADLSHVITNELQCELPSELQCVAVCFVPFQQNTKVMLWC